jgi:broad specificity phosphatase PhoE
MRLLLIRHAETASNVADVIDTQVPGKGLTVRGEQQAQDLAARIADERVEAVYASTLIRTALTATPLATLLSLPVVVVDGLQEIAAGALETKGDRQSINTYLTTVESWVGGALSFRMPGGEDCHEFIDRYDSVVREVVDSGYAVAAVFSHGCAIRTWVSIRARSSDPALAIKHDIENTEVVVLEGTPTGWFLKSDAITG